VQKIVKKITFIVTGISDGRYDTPSIDAIDTILFLESIDTASK